MHRFELVAWDRQTDRWTDGSHHCLLPPMGGQNKLPSRAMLQLRNCRVQNRVWTTTRLSFWFRRIYEGSVVQHNTVGLGPIGNESVPIELAQCWFPGLAISNDKISNILSAKNTRKQFYQTALGNCYRLKLAKCRLQFYKINLLCYLL